jgi:hypothetical protein
MASQPAVPAYRTQGQINAAVGDARVKSLDAGTEAALKRAGYTEALADRIRTLLPLEGKQREAAITLMEERGERLDAQTRIDLARLDLDREIRRGQLGVSRGQLNVAQQNAATARANAATGKLRAELTAARQNFDASFRVWKEGRLLTPQAKAKGERLGKELGSVDDTIRSLHEKATQWAAAGDHKAAGEAFKQIGVLWDRKRGLIAEIEAMDPTDPGEAPAYTPPGGTPRPAPTAPRSATPPGGAERRDITLNGKTFPGVSYQGLVTLLTPQRGSSERAQEGRRPLVRRPVMARDATAALAEEILRAEGRPIPPTLRPRHPVSLAAEKRVGMNCGPKGCTSFVTHALKDAGYGFGSNSASDLRQQILSRGGQIVTTPRDGDLFFHVGGPTGYSHSGVYAGDSIIDAPGSRVGFKAIKRSGGPRMRSEYVRLPDPNATREALRQRAGLSRLASRGGSRPPTPEAQSMVNETFFGGAPEGAPEDSTAALARELLRTEGRPLPPARPQASPLADSTAELAAELLRIEGRAPAVPPARRNPNGVPVLPPRHRNRSQRSPDARSTTHPRRPDETPAGTRLPAERGHHQAGPRYACPGSAHRGVRPAPTLRAPGARQDPRPAVEAAARVGARPPARDAEPDQQPDHGATRPGYP